MKIKIIFVGNCLLQIVKTGAPDYESDDFFLIPMFPIKQEDKKKILLVGGKSEIENITCHTYLSYL